ncbi:GNAT family N-acetyltransferase [Altererythrobacter sp. CAU 1778]
MFHRTDRLFLRPIFPEDWPAILSGIAELPIVRNLAQAPWPYAEADARAFAARTPDPAMPTFAVTLPSPDGGAQYIGQIGFVEHAGELQIGYWFAREYWNHGYATEAACGLIEIARMMGMKHLGAVHFVDNPASGAVLRKAGFKPTGQSSKLHSVARGRADPCLHYAIDLAGDCCPTEWKRAA